MTACPIAERMKPRSLFEWEPPPGVAVEQVIVKNYFDPARRQTVHTQRYTARCACGLATTAPEPSRADALDQLGALHR